MRGNWSLSQRGRKDIARARRFFGQALEIDPRSTLALSGLAFALCWVNLFAWEEDLKGTRANAVETAQRAVDLDENDALAHAVLGWARFNNRQLDGAIAACQRAIERNPSLAIAHSILSICYSWQGENEAAVDHAKWAERLSPRDPAHSMWSFARTAAEFGAANYDEAVEWANLTIEALPEFPGVWRYLAASLAFLGRNQEAAAAVRQLLSVLPHDNLHLVESVFPSNRAERHERFVEGLRLAGLPET